VTGYWLTCGGSSSSSSSLSTSETSHLIIKYSTPQTIWITTT